jgi:hypothetical protein
MAPDISPAPCGCPWRAVTIIRQTAFLWPTAFVQCRCSLHRKTWTERYEFDFTIPMNGHTWEDQKKE